MLIWTVLVLLCDVLCLWARTAAGYVVPHRTSFSMLDYDVSDIFGGHVSNEEDYFDSDSDSSPEVWPGGARDDDVAIEAICRVG